MENARVSWAMGTFYEVLGVRRDSTADDIKQAYHRLAFEYHPDKNPSPAAAEKMKEINEAYRVLGHAELRAEYDAKAFPPAGDNLYARWYKPSSDGFGQGPGAADGYRAEPRQRSGVYKPITFFSRKHLVPAAKVGLAFGIAIAFLILGADHIQQKFGAWAIVALAAAAVFLPPFASVLLLWYDLNNKAEAGFSASVTLAVALFVAWLAWGFTYQGPDYGWCLTCCAMPALCAIAGWLIGNFIGQGTWKISSGKRPLK
ncbi:MAG TPA: DnaJ domain-containing protein [Methanocella sp.]|nr:DnaJ domain-containing protein [Methanocella sp.]